MVENAFPEPERSMLGTIIGNWLDTVKQAHISARSGQPAS